MAEKAEREMTRVEQVFARVDELRDSYQDVLVVGVLENGALDLQPSITQYPWVHWILNKTVNEAWMMERRELEVRQAAEAQIVESEGGNKEGGSE